MSPPQTGSRRIGPVATSSARRMFAVKSQPREPPSQFLALLVSELRHRQSHKRASTSHASTTPPLPQPRPPPAPNRAHNFPASANNVDRTQRPAISMKCFADPQAQSVKSALFWNSENNCRSHSHYFNTYEHPATARLNFGRRKSSPQPFVDRGIELIIFEKNAARRVRVDIYSGACTSKRPTLQFRRVPNPALSR